MTSWPNSPPDPETITPLRLIRAPARSSLKTTIISPEIQGALTHYNGSRTVRCPLVNCPECAKHHKPRWYGYVAIFNPVTNATAIFEFPSGPYATVREFLEKYKSLRGTTLTAWRKPARENGPVFLTLEPPTDPSLSYPDPPNLMKVLCRMWGLDYKAERRELVEQMTKQATGVDPPVDTESGIRQQDKTRQLDRFKKQPRTSTDLKLVHGNTYGKS